jgi:hypothetical protein
MSENETPLAETVNINVVEAPKRSKKKIALIAAATTAAVVGVFILARRPETQTVVDTVTDAVTPDA